MKLKVMIGPHRFDMAVAHVNDQARPTEIDTPLFAGRVVVFVKDFVGVAPEGQPIKEHPYFAGRSRKFAILIEGRFKQREGVAPYTGDEIQFGSDFDFLPASFPQGPFNAGLKVAQYVDPATHAEMHAANGRPFIMSPYTACMNTFCAYPAPNALSRALVLAQHDPTHPHNDGETSSATFVPREEVDGNGPNGKKTTRHDVQYWRFVGLRGDPPVEDFVEKHKHLLAPTPAEPEPTPSPTRPNRPLFTKRSTLSLGTSLAKVESPSHDSSIPSHATGRVREESPHRSLGPLGWGAPIPKSSGDDTPDTPTQKKKAGRFSLAGLMGALEKESPEVHLHEGDLTTADKLLAELSGDGAEGVTKHLGPWRFDDPNIDAIEDNLFIFLDPSHNRTVAQRRKHFVQNHGQHRKDFIYSSDVVYTASFFTSFCDLNTFDLKMGPVNLNIASHFAEMPIRYTLRSTRVAPRPDGKEGEEEEVFCTISFQLVDG